MKRFTLLAAALLLGGLSMNAQSSCATAQALTVGNNASSTVTVAPLTGDPTPIAISCVTANDGVTNDQNGAWYSYTPTQDVVVTVTTDLASNGTPNETGGNPDSAFYYPTLEIFTGACGSLAFTTCDFGDVGDGNAEVAFVAVSGTTYYVVFNDLLAQLGAGTTTSFDFEISTDTNVPAPAGVAVNPTPADDAVNVVVDEGDNNSDGQPDNSVVFSFDPPTSGGTPERYFFYFGTSSNINDLTNYGYLTPADISSFPFGGLSHNTEYFWAIRPTNVAGGPDEANLPIWSFTTEDTAGIEDTQLAGVSFYPNPVVNELSIDMPGSVELESATMFNLLGKQTKVSISENSTIDMSQMASGVYILKLETNQGTMTKKIIKN